MNVADAVVIGAGINGSSCAYNLLKRGLKKVVLVDKGLIASGGTGDSAAIVRQHYSHEALIKLVRRSVDIFINFDDIVGGNPDYHRTGWAFLVPNHASSAFEHNLLLQQSLGVATRSISVDDLHEIEPRIQVSGVAKIAYEPDSGYCEPKNSIVHAYVKRFVDLGGELQDNNAVTALSVEGRRICSVTTSKGSIHTRVVVVAAGPWSSAIAKWAHVALPINVTREQEFIIECQPFGGPPKIPFSDFAQAIYYRPHMGSRALLGRGYPKEYEFGIDPDNFNRSSDGEFIEEVRSRFHKRFPLLQNAICVHGFSGIYDVTPDWNPILGKVDGVEGIYICAGFSGHGFKIAPAIGECLADQIVDGESSLIDLNVFNLNRFEKQSLLFGAYGGNRA